MKVKFNTWFKYSMGISASLIAIYVILHIVWNDQGLKVTPLSAIQHTVCISIMESQDTVKDKSGDSVKKDILLYLENQLNVGSVTKRDSLKTNVPLKKYVNGSSLRVIKITLPSHQFTTKSFFWLTGNLVYLELLLWIWFGLIASVVYTGVKQKVFGAFDEDFIYDHIGKFSYGTIVAVVLYLATDVLTSNNLITVASISYGSIVYVFILGFFHNRAIELLNRLKDVLIPTSSLKDNDGMDVKTKIENVPKGNSIMVELVSATNNTVYRQTTRKDEELEFKSVPAGKYDLIVTQNSLSSQTDSPRSTVAIIPQQISVGKKSLDSKNLQFDIDLSSRKITPVIND